MIIGLILSFFGGIVFSVTIEYFFEKIVQKRCEEREKQNRKKSIN